MLQALKTMEELERYNYISNCQLHRVYADALILEEKIHSLQEEVDSLEERIEDLEG